MIEANKNENFPITVSLVDEVSSLLVEGQIVSYDMRTINDSSLSPSISGILDESTVVGGIYKKELSIPASGSFVCYITCSGFVTSTEEIIINSENIYEVVKNTHQYNISVEDILRETVIPTTSQTIRKVPLNTTDYIINIIKDDTSNDWSNASVSGTTWAWYRSTTDSLPYKMGSEF